MIKRSLVFALIAVVSAAFLVVGCSQGTDSGSSSGTVIGGRLVDIEVNSEDGLVDALRNPEYQVIGVNSSGALTLDLVTEIPAGKTVVLFSKVTPKATDGLEVKGTLVVEGAGILAASNSARVRVTDGTIEVVNGTIEVDSAVAIHGRDIEIQILGTGKAYFSGGTLKFTRPLATLEDVKTAFGWIGQKGTLLLDAKASDGVTPVSGVTQPVKPSDLAAINTTATRRITILNTLNNDPASPDVVETLEIPAGLTFATADPMPNLTTLTVGGRLSATKASLAKVTNLTVTGDLVAATATYNTLTELTVSGTFGVGTALSALETLTVNEGGAFTSTSSVGSAAADAAGITIAVAKEGAATINAINKLKPSTIAGSLTALSFTPQDATASAASPLNIAPGGTINGITLPSAAVVSGLAADGATIEDFTIAANQTFEIPAGTALTIAAGKTFTYDGLVTIEATGSLVLAGTGTTLAKIAGTGKISAGLTDITGSWETTTGAGAETGTLTILSADIGATITAADPVTGLKAGAAGATITQNAGASNTLTIAAATEIGLAGDGVRVGAIILKNDTETAAATDNGKLSLAAATSKITTAATGTVTPAPLSADGTTMVADGSNYTSIGLPNLAGDGTNAKIAPSNTPATASTSAAGKIVSITGGSGATVTGGDDTTTGPDGIIAGDILTAADETA
ncbi:MAG: hypothetical protein LBG10_07465 [Treponema sp.]|jgi:hypothetical protein|nr:hypothetical protein [Treponema sp.]